MLNSNLINQAINSLSNNFNFSSLSYSYKEQTANSSQATKESSSIVFESDNTASTTSDLYSQLGSSSNYRNNLFTNPIISYDFKCGHYLGIWDKLYPSLITSFIEQARGIRKSS
jgi:hypothetical protein